MNALTQHLGGGLLVFGIALGVMLSGWVPDDSMREQVPVSVRDNPDSYKPSYVIFTGYHPRVTSTGGYSTGK